MDTKLLLLWMIACQVLAATPESFNTSPPPFVTSFSCIGRPMGFYADIGTNCRGYHTCDDHGNHFMNYCPEDTAFRQDAMVCDHAYLVNCKANIDSVNPPTRIGQDNNHDAPPLSFIEPHDKETNVKGFARSFRINPDAKSSSSAKHSTFVLNSSVFLKDRYASKEQKLASTGTRAPDNEFSMTTVMQKDYSHNPFLATHSKTTSNEIVLPDQLISLSRELQPPIKSLTISEESSETHNEDYSFLIPPAVRDDNVNFAKNSFTLSKLDDIENSNSRLSVMSSESFNVDSINSFEKDSIETVTFSPRTTMILDMMKAQTLDETFDSDFFKPSKLLLPPLFKSDFSASARSNFNFRSNNYPYVETLKSIQNNKATTYSTTQSPLRIHVTDASIFAVPTKSLAPAKDMEKDPYYPKLPTSTEMYYTSQLQSDKSRKPQFTTTRRPFSSNAKFEIPAVLPDLNSLEDLLDRRKIFFIPQIKS
ncbi:uncharacterized protein LOC131665323 [Phymastichus coffea]|uniref:uncharacterized protein LOC131665323 n=1 Tax=Phymastichus coffea TaxID=108790 RepID=UPI00273CB0FD|nr:uncharacterized protein LOC131665323 [Phymastichus coffea]